VATSYDRHFVCVIFMPKNHRPTILFVGPVPPPVFGQAIAMRVLLDSSELRDRYNVVHVNTNNVNKSGMRRVFSTGFSLSQCLWASLSRRPSTIYLTITRSKLGCIKDCIVLSLARVRGTSVVVHLHGGDLAVFYQSLGGFGKRLIHWAYRHITLGIVLGESLRPQFNGLLPPDRVRVVSNTWLAGECALPARRPQRQRHEPLKIAFVSNVLPSKGLYDALEGVAWAVREGVDLEFRFAGQFMDHDGAIAKLPELEHENEPAQMLEERYFRMVHSLGIAGHVIRIGAVTGLQKWQLLAETDALLLPIYNPMEGQPLVAIEAMRMGCALISTRCGGLADIVVDSITGRVVPAGNPEMIGRAIKWFWDHPADLTRIGRANMARAEELHSPARHIRGIVESLEEAIGCSGRNRVPVADIPPSKP